MESNFFLKIDTEKISFLIDDNLTWEIKIEDVAIMAYMNSESGGEPINTIAIVSSKGEVDFLWLYSLRNYKQVISFLSENFNFNESDYSISVDRMDVFYPKDLHGFHLYNNSLLSFLIRVMNPAGGRLSRIMKEYLKNNNKKCNIQKK